MRRERRRLVTFAILLILALALIGAGRSGVLRPLATVLMAPLAPVARLFTGGTQAAADLTAQREDYATLEQRHRELEGVVAELQVEIVRLREIEQDYYRLSEILNYATQHADQQLVTANVIARDTSGYLRWIIINRGTIDGIQVGNPVISDLGLVGRVEDVAATTAWVRLAIDQGSAINAILQGSRAEGIVVGQLQGGLRMSLIPQEALVEAGDLVLTSGLGGSFPSDIVIGQVASVRQQQAALFQEAEIRPTVDFSRLELVSVITSFEPADLSVFDEMIEGQGAGQ
jgi:rod shape-determining protein MreC